MTKIELRNLIERFIAETRKEQSDYDYILVALWEYYDILCREEPTSITFPHSNIPGAKRITPELPDNIICNGDCICPKCGAIGRQSPIVLTTYPCQYQYECPDCGHKWTRYARDITLTTITGNQVECADCERGKTINGCDGCNKQLKVTCTTVTDSAKDTLFANGARLHQDGNFDLGINFTTTETEDFDSKID